MTDWNSETLAQLRTLWEAGRTGQEIADFFGNRTRSAVIAKAGRLGLKQPPKLKKPKGQLLSKGYRKAFASQGDDMRARFVRVDQGDGEHGRKRRQNRPRLPGFESPSFRKAARNSPSRSARPTRIFSSAATIISKSEKSFVKAICAATGFIRYRWKSGKPARLRASIGKLATATICPSPSVSITRLRIF
jgi:hypothetical protein